MSGEKSPCEIIVKVRSTSNDTQTENESQEWKSRINIFNTKRSKTKLWLFYNKITMIETEFQDSM